MGVTVSLSWSSIFEVNHESGSETGSDWFTNVTFLNGWAFVIIITLFGQIKNSPKNRTNNAKNRSYSGRIQMTWVPMWSESNHQGDPLWTKYKGPRSCNIARPQRPFFSTGTFWVLTGKTDDGAKKVFRILTRWYEIMIWNKVFFWWNIFLRLSVLTENRVCTTIREHLGL